MTTKRFILMLLVMLGSVTGALAQRFISGEFLYEPVTIGGVNGCQLLCHKDCTPEAIRQCTYYYEVNNPHMTEEEIADYIPEIVIPSVVSNGNQQLPVLKIYRDAFNQLVVRVGGTVRKDDSPYQLRFAENSQIKVIDKQAIRATKICGKLTIPASVETLGEFDLEEPYDELCFEDGTQITELPSYVDARMVRIPATVTTMKRMFSNTHKGVATDVYVSWYDKASSVPQGTIGLSANLWPGEHRLHIPVGTSSIYQSTIWVTELHYTLVEDVVLDGADYAATQNGVIDEALTGIDIPFLTQMVQNYKSEIEKARIANDLSHIVDLGVQCVSLIQQVVNDCNAIRQQAHAAGAAEAYTAPTGTGMRLKVTKKDGKVYEFQTSELQKVNYYRATE